MLRIGTDCSGIEAPIEALNQLGIPFEHKWACEIDPFARRSILANYQPEIMYTDITKRDNLQLPDIDVYVCGFPCQPFSLIGKKMGTEDSRSNIMYQCIKLIKKKLPKVFILENVKNFKFIEKGKPFNYLLSQLKNIKNNDGGMSYNIYHDILNTNDYGIPQNRERIFFIGIRKDIQKKNMIYTTPEKLPSRPLDDYIIDKTIYTNTNIPNTIQKKLDKINNGSNYIIPCSNFSVSMKNRTPTLTTSCGAYFHSTYKRYLTQKECLLLQGFNKNFKQVVSNYQMFKQIGNSMSVNVLKVIFNEIFNITNIIE